MPVSRWAPALSVLALYLGLMLVIGSWSGHAPTGSSPPPTVAAVTTSPGPSPILSATPSSTLGPTLSPTATPVPAIPAGYRIKIPRLTIDLPIAEGEVERDIVRQETPENVALHFPGSAIPGAGGNSYIYAHARRGMFLSLWSARVGDEIWITAPDARELRYVVSEVHPRVDPTDVSWAARSAGERLTLQTSTGPNSGDPRFVVIALPV
jgi:LPXTG-site transpeptidase (sortase) family protein